MKAIAGLQQGQSGDKEPLFDAIDAWARLTALIGMVPNIQANKDIMLEPWFYDHTTWLIIWYARACHFVTPMSWLGKRCSWPSARVRLEELSAEELNIRTKP